MTALDEQWPELDLSLHRLRARLNRRYLAGEALAAALVTGAVALVPAWFLLPAVRPWAWTAVTLAAGMLAAALRWPRRLTRAQAGAWLDETRGSFGLFAAATDALQRGQLRFPDDAILLQATKRHGEATSVKLPWKRLALRAAAVVVLSALAVVGFSLVVAPKAVAAAQAPAEESTPPGVAPSFGGPSPQALLTPRESARRLFPEDDRLAALAEQALAAGDAKALESLLEQNPPSTGPGDPGKTGPKKPNRSGSRTDSPGPGQGFGTQPGTDTPEGSRGDPSPAPGSQRDSGKAGNPQGPPSPRGSGGSSDRRGEGSGSGSGDSGAGPQGGDTAGTTHSELALGPKDFATATDGSFVVPGQGTPGFFEYVLPETGAKVPLSQVLPDSRRAAEAALDRSSAPQEFENAVRDYFLKLSQEAQP